MAMSGSGHKAVEQGMRTIGAALKLRMVLHAHIEGAVGQFHRLYQPAVGGKTAEYQPA